MSVFITAAGRLKRFSRHSACLKAKKSRYVNENVNDMNRREQMIEKFTPWKCSQHYNKHVMYRLEHFKRPAAVKKKTDYSCLLDVPKIARISN